MFIEEVQVLIVLVGLDRLGDLRSGRTSEFRLYLRRDFGGRV
jgi:hypothetical protein